MFSKKRLIVFVVITAILLLHFNVSLQWMEANQLRAKGVCCGFVDPVFERIVNLHDRQSAWTPDRGILPMLVAYWHRFTPDSNFLLSFSTLCVSLSMLLTFWATHLVTRGSFR